MTVVANIANPETNPFTIVFTSTAAEESDIKTHEVNYKVSSVDYPSDVAEISGTFSFTIECPTSLSSSTLITPTSNQVYDLGENKQMIITPPIISYSPSICFPIQTYVLASLATGTTPIYATIKGTVITINS